MLHSFYFTNPYSLFLPLRQYVQKSGQFLTLLHAVYSHQSGGPLVNAAWILLWNAAVAEAFNFPKILIKSKQIRQEKVPKHSLSVSEAVLPYSDTFYPYVHKFLRA